MRALSTNLVNLNANHSVKWTQILRILTKEA